MTQSAGTQSSQLQVCTQSARPQSSLTHRFTAPPARVILDVGGNLEFFIADAEVKHVVVNNAMGFWIETLKNEMKKANELRSDEI